MEITPDKAMQQLHALYEQYKKCTGGDSKKASRVFLRCVNDELKIEAKPRWGFGWTAKLGIRLGKKGGEYDFAKNAEKLKELFHVALKKPLLPLEKEQGLPQEGNKLEELAQHFGRLAAHVSGKEALLPYIAIVNKAHARQESQRLISELDTFSQSLPEQDKYIPLPLET